MYRERERAEGILENFFLAKLYNITFVNVSQVGFDLDGIVYMVKIVSLSGKAANIRSKKCYSKGADSGLWWVFCE